MVNKPNLYQSRRNKDGSYGAVCLSCFATIAHGVSELDLEHHLKSHTCDSAFLADRGVLPRVEASRGPAPHPRVQKQNQHHIQAHSQAGPQRPQPQSEAA